MLSSHLYLYLPCDLLIRGFPLNVFLTVLVSGILCTCPNQLVFEPWILQLSSSFSSSSSSPSSSSSSYYIYSSTSSFFSFSFFSFFIFFSLFFSFFFFLFETLNFLVDTFGPPNDHFLLLSILDANYPDFDLHLADILRVVILPSVLGTSLWSFG